MTASRTDSDYLISIASDVRTIRRIVKFFFILWLVSLLVIPLAAFAVAFLLPSSSSSKFEDIGDNIGAEPEDFNDDPEGCEAAGFRYVFSAESCTDSSE